MKQHLTITPRKLTERFPHWDFGSIRLDVGGELRRLFFGVKRGEHLLLVGASLRKLLKRVSRPQHFLAVLGGSTRLSNLAAWNDFCDQVEVLG